MRIETPLGEYPFVFRGIERREGGIAVVGTVAGLLAAVTVERRDLLGAGRRAAPALGLAAGLLFVRRCRCRCRCRRRCRRRR